MLIFPSFLLEDVCQAMTANTEAVTAPKISQEPCCHLVVCLFLVLTGGRVIFNVGNDSPTLTGAKITFTIDLEFPHNQRVQPNGDVVWAEDCVINGKHHLHTHTVDIIVSIHKAQDFLHFYAALLEMPICKFQFLSGCCFNFFSFFKYRKLIVVSGMSS